jgi:hypothetical protein
MSRLAFLLVIGAASGGLVSCGDGEGDGSGATAGEVPNAGEAQPGDRRTVSAQANIFGAGREEPPPSPGGGGSGVKPPVWRLPPGSNRVVTVPSVAGQVTPIVGKAGRNGPEGDGIGGTDVYSWHGISGIVHRRNGMFLVGVFLGDGPPKGDAPRRLNFTKRERFESLAPRIGQTFLVGDGRGHSYAVPADATRLYLGFADGYYYTGNPGWYGNNDGKLSATVAMTSR